MARLNGKRRRAAEQRRAATLFGKLLNATTQADAGGVRSSTGPAKRNHANLVVPAVARALSPKPLDLDAPPKRGKITGGRFVPAPKGPKRFS